MMVVWGLSRQMTNLPADTIYQAKHKSVDPKVNTHLLSSEVRDMKASVSCYKDPVLGSVHVRSLLRAGLVIFTVTCTSCIQQHCFSGAFKIQDDII